MSLKRDKELCFTRDEEYTLIISAPNKHLMIMQCEEEVDNSVETKIRCEEIHEHHETDKDHHLSLNVLKGGNDAAPASIPSHTSNKSVSKSIIPQGLGNQLPFLKFKYYLDC